MVEHPAEATLIAMPAADGSVDVFIPSEFSSWEPPPGAGIVGSLTPPQLVVYYEDEVEPYGDRVRIAFERLDRRTPTTKRRELRRADVIPVGSYNARDGEVVVDSYLRELMMRFLAIEPGGPHATETLERECRSTHVDHRRRRRIRHQIANAGKNRAQAEAARECARRYGYDDLLR
jgi:hypothetical protein